MAAFIALAVFLVVAIAIDVRVLTALVCLGKQVSKALRG